MEDNELLQTIYYDAKTGYSGATELYRRAKRKSKSITFRKVKEFLSKQETVQAFKGANAKREARQFHIEAERGTYQIDHCFLSNRKINNGYHAIFCAVEIGSRWAFACAMKNIREEAVIDAFNKLYAATRKRLKMRRIITDEGVEFGSHAVKEWLEEKGIAHRTLDPTYHYYSNSIVERFNLTLKQKLQKYMVANHTKKWVDALDDVVYAYNRSRHSYHKERPKDVAKNPILQLIHRIETIQRNSKLRQKKDFVLNPIKPGSQVRLIRKTDQAFSKKIQKYGKKVHTVEAITKGRTMVQVKGKDRMIRPWEVATADVVETNPFARRITSPDVEQALANARAARKSGKTSRRKVRDPLVSEAKKTKEVSQDMIGKWIETEDGIQGTVKRATKHGLWLDTTAKGKRSEMLVRKGDSYTELTQPPKQVVEEKPLVSAARLALTGASFHQNSKIFKVVRVDSKRVVCADELGNEISIAIDDDETTDDASKQLAVNLFAKTLDWKRCAIPIRTEEDGAPFWLGKAIGKPRQATQWDASKSGGEIDEGWLVIPMLWYDALPGKSQTYSITKNKISSTYSTFSSLPTASNSSPTRRPSPRSHSRRKTTTMLTAFLAAEKR